MNAISHEYLKLYRYKYVSYVSNKVIEYGGGLDNNWDLGLSFYEQQINYLGL